MNQETEFWVATSAIPGVGTVTFNYLLKKFKVLSRFWNAPDSEIKKLKLDAKTCNLILEFRQKVDPKVYLEKVYSLGIKVVTVAERQYPQNLRTINGAPPVLYFKGNFLESDDLAVAVVGSRYSSIYGRQVTEKFTFDLVKAGLTIVSGLARGIDATAHRMALDAGGRTIAVLGSGLDSIYPPENKKLAEEIANNGALVSEFPLGYPALPNNFTARNRIISGMSLGVLVTEAAVDSGSLITAGYAAEQAREVFAVPGPITSKTAEGVNKLIKEGVHPVTEAREILEILEVERKARQLETVNSEPETLNLNKEQGRILEILDREAKHIDLISRQLNVPVKKVSSTLSVMEISGFVKNYGSGMWGR